MQALAVELDREPAVALLLEQLVGAAIPDLDGAGSVLSCRDLALEVGVVERVILDVHRQMPLPGLLRDPLRHRPAGERPVALEPQVVVQPSCGMALHDEDGRPTALSRVARTAPAYAAGSRLRRYSSSGMRWSFSTARDLDDVDAVPRDAIRVDFTASSARASPGRPASSTSGPDCAPPPGASLMPPDRPTRYVFLTRTSRRSAFPCSSRDFRTGDKPVDSVESVSCQAWALSTPIERNLARRDRCRSSTDRSARSSRCESTASRSSTAAASRSR